LGGHRPLVPPGESSGEEEEEHHEADSIFDRYNLGFNDSHGIFSDDFPEDANEYEGEMSFDTSGGFSRDYSNEKNFELYDDDQNEQLGDVDSDDSDDDEDHDEDHDLWVEKKVADVGSPTGEDNGFPPGSPTGQDDSFGDFIKSENHELQEDHHENNTPVNTEGMATESS